MTHIPEHEKYDSSNPIAKKMIAGFMNNFTNLVNSISEKTNIETVTECGCGQGHIIQLLEELLPKALIKGIDVNSKDLNIAHKNRIHSTTELYQKSIYDIGENEKAKLVVCCEVLEHLDDPFLALKKMTELKADYYLFSVPNEPIWRILNFLRGKYVRDWGNTPDHCNHWSPSKFKKFVSQHLDVVNFNKPFPWTMILAKTKSKSD